MKPTSRSVLIFGGAGFIGSNWAARVLGEENSRVHIFDDLSREGARHNLDWLRSFPGSSRLRVTIGDVRDAELVQRAIEDADEVYHFAAQVAVTSSLVDPRHDLEVNLLGTFNILEAIRARKHRPFFVFTSTNKVYGDIKHSVESAGSRYEFADTKAISEDEPLDFHSPYGCSKGAADQYVRDYARIYGIPGVVLRMSCIAGPHQFGNEDQGWVAHFLYSALLDRPVFIYGDGRQVRDVLCVEDLMDAFESLRSNLQITAGQIYNIGGGPENSTSLLELLELLEQKIGRKLLCNFEKPRPGDQLVYITDYSKLHRHTGWKPRYSLNATLDVMAQWGESHLHLLRDIGSYRDDAVLNTATGIAL